MQTHIWFRLMVPLTFLISKNSAKGQSANFRGLGIGGHVVEGHVIGSESHLRIPSQRLSCRPRATPSGAHDSHERRRGRAARPRTDRHMNAFQRSTRLWSSSTRCGTAEKKHAKKPERDRGILVDGPYDFTSVGTVSIEHRTGAIILPCMICIRHKAGPRGM